MAHSKIVLPVVIIHRLVVCDLTYKLLVELTLVSVTALPLPPPTHLPPGHLACPCTVGGWVWLLQIRQRQRESGFPQTPLCFITSTKQLLTHCLCL